MKGPEKGSAIINSLGWAGVTAKGVVVGESIAIATDRESLDELLKRLEMGGHSYREIGGRFSLREASLNVEIIGTLVVETKLPKEVPTGWCFTGEFVKARGGNVPEMISYGTSSLGTLS